MVIFAIESKDSYVVARRWQARVKGVLKAELKRRGLSYADLAEKLDADRKDPDARTATEEARVYVREKHSWAKRAEQIYARLAYGTPTGFEQD